MTSKFNFDNCTLNNSQVGDKNFMSISNPVINKDWEELEKFFESKLQMLEKDTIYYFLAKEAEDYTKKRDKKGLKDFIQKYASEFASGIFCNIASTGIINILERLGIQI